MARIHVIPLFLVACSGAEQRHVSTFRMPHGGTCPDDNGCEAPVVAEAQYATPDSSRPAPDGTPAPPGATPDPDCALVGSELASLDVGNYADPDVRAPLVAKYEARCHKEALTLEERQCIVQTQTSSTRYYYGTPPRTKALVSYCAARMLPELPAIQLVPTTRCLQIATAVRARFANLPPQSTGPRRIWDAKMEVLARSCEQDRWTADFGTCVEKRSQPVEPLATCLHEAPFPLRMRIDDRTDKALRAVSGAR